MLVFTNFGVAAIPLYKNSDIRPKHAIVNTFTNYDELDQSMTSYGGVFPFGNTISFGYDGNISVAQSFKPQKEVLTRAQFLMARNYTTVAPCWLAVRENLTGEDLAVVSVEPNYFPLVDGIPTEEQLTWVEFNFDDIQITPNKTYYLILYTANINENYYWASINDIDVYLRGSLFLSFDDGHIWSEYNDEDICFKTFGRDNGPGHWLYVGGSGPGNYSKIQDAINASFDGDTVFVYNGNYTENINVNKSIFLLGENKEKTCINGWGYNVVRISADGIIFSGFTILDNSEVSYGIRMYSSSFCTISNNIIKASWGINFYNANDNLVTDNSIFTIIAGICIGDQSSHLCKENMIKNNTITNSGNPIYVYNDGISIWDTAVNNSICENYLYDCVTTGIYIENAKNNNIERNVITCNQIKSTYGIEVVGESSFGNVIKGNNISYCQYGILTNSYYQIFSENYLSNNNEGMYNGLVPHNLTINNNIFKNNTRGLYIDNGYNNTIEGNIFNSNVVGLQLDLSFLNCICKNTLISNFIGINLAVSYLNSITSNNFLSNNITVIMYLSTNLWYANYWNKPRSLPKPIIGILPFVQFDWHPAKEPYDILGMS